MPLLSRICLSVCVSESEETTNPKHSNFAFRATQIKTYSWDNAQVIMVGNKCDMDEERVVPPEKGKHLADQLGETLPPRTISFFYLHPDQSLFGLSPAVLKSSIRYITLTCNIRSSTYCSFPDELMALFANEC